MKRLGSDSGAALKAAVLFGLVVGLGACSRGDAAEEGPTLQTTDVVRDDLEITVEATGSVEPIRTVEVKSKASGEILRLHVDVGDAVQRGDLLAEVDPRDVRNDHNQAQADLEVAEARLEIAEAQLQRSEELLAAEVITEQEHEGRALEFANARAQLVRAQTNLELAELRLSDVTIRAPMDGTILTRNVEQGTVIQSASGNVSGGTTLFLMADLGEMQARTLVDETDMGQIAAGMSAAVVVEAFPGRTFRGSVEKVEPQAVIQQNVTMFPVIVRLDNRSGLLKPGMNSEVEVMVSSRTNALLAPNSAIVQVRDAGPAALVLGLDPESATFDGSVFAGLMAEHRGEEPPSAEAGASPAGQEAPPSFEEIRAKIQSGEITRDSARALMQASGGSFGRPGAGGAPGGASGRQESGPQSAVTFVVLADGTVEPRAILIGLNDWDNTEILAGVEEGEQLALIGAAQLQAQQQEWVNRIRERMGGGVPGMGGPR
jgi:HlyD family secretion protein